MHERIQQKNERMKEIQNTLNKIHEHINETKSLEPLLANYFQYIKFVELNVIPTIGKDAFYQYLIRLAMASLDNGTITKLRELNYTTLCRIAFNSSTSNINKYRLEKYPQLYQILSKVIDDIKAEKKYTVESILELCKEKIEGKEPLDIPLQIYKENVDWKYLNFIETKLIPNIGENGFYQYVKDFLLDRLNEGLIKTYSHQEVVRLLLDDGNYRRAGLIKSKERYPILFRLIKQAINFILSLGTQGKRKLINAFLKEKIEKLNKLSEENLLKHCKKLINDEFNSKRIRINKIGFYRVLFQEETLTRRFFNKDKGFYSQIRYIEKLNDLLEKEILNQKNYMSVWNKQSLKMSDDVWTIFFIRGVSLHSIKIDFNLVQGNQLRRELKMYYIQTFETDNPYATYKNFSNIYKGLKALQENFSIRKLADINKLHVGFLIQYLEYKRHFSIVTIKKTVSSLSLITEYLIDKNDYKFKPDENVFNSVTIHNSEAMSKNTEYIPDEVLDQIEMHLDELAKEYRLMYEIYSATGIRPKEVIELEINCSELSKEYEGFAELKYIPYKIKKARKKRGMSDYNFAYITTELYEKIQNHIDENKEIYLKYELNYLFARKTVHGVFVPKSRDFCLAINKLIKAHNICDIEGRLWHFTSKQTRKTVAVNLIENNATPQEVANQLGHLDVRTTYKYYLEVKKAKLADLNAEFFKKKFELNVGKENLDLYSEEQRKQLYVDFCLNRREVELGNCTKHYSEGECGTRVGASNCATCSKLCTGRKYLGKWEELKKSQIEVIEELQRIYKENGIDDYHDFIEYKKEIKLLNRYDAVISEINKSG